MDEVATRSDPWPLLAVADSRLRVLLADPQLTSLFGADERLVVGRSLLELFSHPEVASDLRLLRSGTAREVRLMTLDGDQCLVASLVTSDVDGAQAVLVQLRPLPAEPAIDEEVFVGRAEQLEAFDQFLGAPEGGMLILEGPIGIGKSALLRAFERRSQRIKMPSFRLDGRTSRFDGDAFATLEANKTGDWFFRFDVASRPWLLLIDHFDIGPTHSIAERAAFFRSLPISCRIVVAGRAHVTSFAFVFPQHRPVICRLGPLTPREAAALASRWGLDGPRLQRAGGHPASIRVLLPSVMSTEPLDELAYAGDLPVPRFALKVAALPRRITEDLLTTLLEDTALASKTYDALAAICMNDPDNLGLRMPEVLRNALAARLARRNPVRYAELRLMIIRYLLDRIEGADPDQTVLLIDDLFDAFESHGGLRRIFGHSDALVKVRRLAADDSEDARTFLREAGRADVPIISRLRTGTPTYVAEVGGQVAGLMQFVVLSSSDTSRGEDRRRLAVRNLFRRFSSAGEARLAALLSFVVTTEEEQDWGPVAQALTREHLRLLLTHRNVTASIVVGDHGWRVFDVPEDVTEEIDGAQARIRDFQKKSLLTRLRDSLGREQPFLRAADDAAPPIGLTTESVRLALASMATGNVDTSLITAIEGVSDERQREVLRAIYIDRRGKHELIAAEMGLPYGTFRRYHARALDRVRELLIEQASSAMAVDPIRENRDASSD